MWRLQRNLQLVIVRFACVDMAGNFFMMRVQEELGSPCMRANRKRKLHDLRNVVVIFFDLLNYLNENSKNQRL